MGKKKLTNEIIDARIMGRPLCRVDNYIDNKTKIS